MIELAEKSSTENLSRYLTEFSTYNATTLSNISLDHDHIREINITKTFGKTSIINLVNNNYNDCCQTCNNCYNNRLCCCTENTCHPIVIKCDSPIKSTIWRIENNDSSDVSEFQEISNGLLVSRTSIIQELNLQTDTAILGNSYQSNIKFNHPNFKIESYIIRASVGNKIIFNSSIKVNGFNIQVRSNLQNAKCKQFIEPCKQTLRYKNMIYL